MNTFYTTFCFLSNIINCQEQLKTIQQTEKKKKYLWSNINHYFTWAVISNAPKNAKTKKILEASYIAIWKPNLNEQKDFERLVYLEMVSHRAIDDIMQTSKKEVHFFFFSVCCIVFKCSWQLIIFYKKQKSCVKLIHLVTDDGLYDWKAFYTVQIVFYSVSKVLSFRL